MYRSLSDSEVREILRRDEVINKYRPSCPACLSKQVKVIVKRPPAMWRCRDCRHQFTSEPER